MESGIQRNSNGNLKFCDEQKLDFRWFISRACVRLSNQEAPKNDVVKPLKDPATLYYIINV